MEQQKLPNTTVSLILSIVAFLGCCCFGIGGVIPSGIALYLSNSDKKKYEENPELYSNYKQSNTARTVAIVALILSALFLLYVIISFVFFGGAESYDIFMESFQREMERQQSLQH
ncbi:hypothetical protein SAMN04488096_104298 [Mesonia phycicola]|uniref:Interferon-induced transmembrane protein n=1 Tax=Mesonia phycicola TaxID=579105 RepID=A0A1M6E147_9FLAO|nr:CCC motif membrane protein [Mesonia phycicola]SHI79244.1 hypothetical protein SAMN04488096_104298 [Mesonia phycicola]